MSQVSPGGPFRQTLFAAGTTGSSTPQNCRGVLNLTVYATASDAISAGTLIIEEADYDPTSVGAYGGTWSQIASITLSTPFSAAGGQYAYHLPAAAYSFVRVRIGTTVVGATLTGTLVGS